MRCHVIDLGSYSIKLLEFELERKNPILKNVEEFPVQEILDDSNVDKTLWEVQLDILTEVMKSIEGKSYKTLILSSEFITSRFLTIPLKSKKKIQMMLPFQLEKDLIYHSNNYHFTFQCHTQKKDSLIIADIVNKEDFSNLFENLKERGCDFNVITSQNSIVNSWIKNILLEESYCLISFGHRKSEVFFVDDKKLISSHVSYVGGEKIDEMIISNFNLSASEARDYKHENSFFLTSEQYESVDDTQKEFGDLMKDVFSDFLLNLKTWILGHRVETGNKIKKVFIYGGVSKIKNFDNFLSVSLGLPVERLNFILDPILKEKSQYFNLQMYAQSMKSNLRPSNLRIGSFAPTNVQNLPLHSISFSLSRVLSICLILIFPLIIERLFLSRGEKDFDRLSKKILNDRNLEISNVLQRQFRKKPKKIMTVLNKKKNDIEASIKELKELSQIDPLTPLNYIKSFIQGNKNTTLLSFSSQNNRHSITIKMNDKKNGKQIVSALKNLPLKWTTINHKELIISGNFEVNQ